MQVRTSCLRFIGAGLLAVSSGFVWAQALTAGVIKRVDAANGKLTIQHEAIKSLDMPTMTMVFYLSDQSLSGGFEVGDRVKFAVEMHGNRMVLTTLQKSQP